MSAKIALDVANLVDIAGVEDGRDGHINGIFAGPIVDRDVGAACLVLIWTHEDFDVRGVRRSDVLAGKAAMSREVTVPP